MGLWESNWKIFDRAQAPAVNGWNSVFGYITSGANLGVSGASSESPPVPAFTFAKGEAGYLWAFNTKTSGPGAEWALVTNNSSDGISVDDWKFPDPLDQTGFPLDWRLSNANAVIFGGLNNFEGEQVRSQSPRRYSICKLTALCQSQASRF